MAKRLLFPYLLFLALLLAACGGAVQPTTSAPVQASIPTHAPTPKPTQKPTANTQGGVVGPTRLGSLITAFVARYGLPNDHTDTKSGSYHFKRYSGSNIDFLIVQTDVFDQGYAEKVESIGVASSDNAATPPITTTVCAPFMPLDAKYQRQVPLSTGNGYDRVYSSVSLAGAFPASAFTDAADDQTKAGLFDVQYLMRSNGSIDSCRLQLGTQQTQ